MELFKKANEIRLGDVFDKNVQDFINSNCKQINSHIGFLIQPLLTVVSHLMGLTQIEITEPSSNTIQEQGFVLFNALISNTDLANLHGFTYIQNLLININIFDGVHENKSKLVKAPKIDDLLYHLNELKTIISFNDDASTFFAQNGRNVYLKLADAPKIFQQDSKGQKNRMTIMNPRLNLCLLGQSSVFTNAIADERGLNKSGIIQKMLISAPNPLIFYETNEQKNDEENLEEKKRSSLVAVLYVVKILHQTSSPIKYKFTVNAREKFREYQQEFKEHSRVSIHTDLFICSMYENAIVMLLRLCGILKALNVSVNFLDKYSKYNYESLSQKLTNEIQKFMSDSDWALSKQRFCISTQIVVNAYDLLEYFNKHKLILAGYEFDISLKLSQTIKQLVDTALMTPKIEIKLEKSFSDQKNSALIRSEKQLHEAIERCLLYSCSRFTHQQLMRKYTDLKKSVVKNAFNFLIENKLGRIEQVKTNGTLNESLNITGGDSAIWFIKTRLDEIQNLTDVNEIFKKYGVTIEAYSKSFEIENETLSNSMKRSATNDHLNKENFKKSDVSHESPKSILKEQNKIFSCVKSQNISSVETQCDFGKIKTNENFTQCEINQSNEISTQYDAYELKNVSCQCDSKILIDMGIQTVEPIPNINEIYQLKHYISCSYQIMNQNKELSDKNQIKE